MSKSAGGMTQREVARELGLSQARIMQIEQAAFRKLRSNPEAIKLLQFVRFEIESREGAV